MTLALTLVAYVVALLQSPGLSSSDTKINLHVDPVTFLGQVASVWSPTEGLGHVQGGQYAGYLWPMGPFFALGQKLGLSGWLTERLWLGTLLALSAWGVILLLDQLLERRRGAGHLLAGALYMLNPYVVVLTSRTTVFLLAYAALPWLMLVTHRALREPHRRWWWAAAFALITTSTGAGVNATVTAFVLVGPVLLAVYEVALREVPVRDVTAFAWRALLTTSAASIWWIVPLLVQSRYGLDFLQYTEQIGAIWASTSITESLRLMGYWPTYLGVGFADTLVPFFGNAETMLFNPFVVVASLLVPALALTGFIWTRRWRYGPLFVLTALCALLMMSVGWPSGTPGRRAADFLYAHLTALQFLRTTYKAGPLLALAIAMLAAGAARAIWPRLGAVARIAAAGGACALVVLSALPFFQGDAIELTWSAIPSAWKQAGAGLTSELPANSRAVVLPGQAYAYYNWGGTVDPILPSLTTRPVAVRNVPPFDDLHAVDLLWTVDDLVQQQRLLPGELRPLLSLMSARAVITATDDDDALSGALAPNPAARELATQPGFQRPSRSYGPVRTFPGAQDTADGPLRLPQVRRYDLPAPGIVRIEPAATPTIVDGSAEGVADIAALHELRPGDPLFYAADESAATIRRQAAAGAEVFITDSNRRRVFVASRMLQNYGWTVSAADGFPSDAALLNPFPARGSEAQTVAVFEGARDVFAPFNPELAQFPEHQPAAAFDGDPSTSWLADTTLAPSDQYVEVVFDRPRQIPYLDLLPYVQNPFARLSQVFVNGRSFAIHPGWNRLDVALRNADYLRITIGHVVATGTSGGTGVGIAEARIPGVRIRELLRPPVIAQDALRGTNLSHTPITYVFERTTAAAPLLRGPAPSAVIARGDILQEQAKLIGQAQDPETGIARRIDPPAARRWTVSGLASVSPAAPDPALDALAGTDTAGASFSSSGRLNGLPKFRASSAFDGSSVTAWAAPLGRFQPAWLAWTTRRPQTVHRLVLLRSDLPVQFPTRVELTVPGAPALTQMLDVGPAGAVRLSRPIRAASFRLTILRAAGSSRPAVAIAEVLGAGTPTVREPAAGAAINGRCGDLTAQVAGRAVALRVRGSVAALDAGSALALEACGAPVALPAAPLDFRIGPSVVRPLLVTLHSPAPQPLVSTRRRTGGEVLSSQEQTDGSFSQVRVRVNGPSWLVLGESYNAGWKATCDGRSLGAPRVIDAFANGWPVGGSCRLVSITFGPQSTVNLGYLLGGLACLILLLALLAGFLRGLHGARRRSPLSAEPPAPLPETGPAPPWAWRPAACAGVVAAVTFGFLFGLRAGVVVGPAYALILWRGVSTRHLLLAVGGLLAIAVPLLYLLFPGTNQGGYDSGYPSQHLAAHWLAVGALALLTLALFRAISTAVPRRHRDRGASRADRASPRAQA